MTKILEIENLKKDYGDGEVLKGINFSVEKGEVVAIIGSSGSGKSTMLRCLNFLENATCGKITLNGKKFFSYDDILTDEEKREKRLHFGLVFQSFNLFPQMTVFENVALAPNLLAKEKSKKMGKSGKEFYKEEKAKNEKKAYAMIERVGLTNKIKAYPCELSGGQQQRVAIARALELSPEILCFDEPTSALDPELTGEVLKVIKSLKSKEFTMIVVTHEMEFAKKVADKVIFMADGIIEEEGSPKEIFDSPKSEKLISFLSKCEEKV